MGKFTGRHVWRSVPLISTRLHTLHYHYRLATGPIDIYENCLINWLILIMTLYQKIICLSWTEVFFELCFTKESQDNWNEMGLNAILSLIHNYNTETNWVNCNPFNRQNHNKQSNQMDFLQISFRMNLLIHLKFTQN